MTRALNRTRLLLPLLAIVFLGGCFGSSPSTRYYAFNSKATDTYNTVDNARRLAVGPFQVPDYLNRPQIVTRNNEKLVVNEFDRWAESLEVGISRRVASDLRQELGDIFVYEFIRTTSFAARHRVLGQVIKFEADQTNTVTLTVVWGITEENETIYGPVESTKIRQIGSSNDMNQVVDAMALLIDDFGADVAIAAHDIIATRAAE